LLRGAESQNKGTAFEVLTITMKKVLALCAILLLGASLASAQTRSSPRFSNRLFTDVVEMTRAGLSDATIVAYVKARRSRLDSDVGAGDLIRLRQAGVSEPVVATIAGITGLDAGQSGPDREVTYDSREGTTVPVEPSYAEDGDYSNAYGYPYWYAYGYPYWYGYGPYFSTRFFIGGRSFHGGGFRGGSGHGGGHGGRGHSGGHGGHGRH
jgi:uncharacterized membrane protein YgcG